MNNFYNEILTEHNVRPEFKYDLPCPTIQLEGVNPNCGDDIWLNLQLKDGVIEDASFNGDGCAISQASADIMIGMIVGKTEAEAKEMLADTGLGLEYAGEEPSTDYDKGQIMAQQPAKGEMVDKNTTISYTVSTGSDKITLPDLENESADDAKAALEKLGLDVSIEDTARKQK
mgnify:CR=1 FL=1